MSAFPETKLALHVPAGRIAAVYAENSAEILKHLKAIDELTDELWRVLDKPQIELGVNAFDCGSDDEQLRIARNLKRAVWQMLAKKMDIYKFMSTKRCAEVRAALDPHASDFDPAGVDSLPDVTEESLHDVAMGQISNYCRDFDEKIREEWEYFRPQNSRYKMNAEQWKVSRRIAMTFALGEFWSRSWDRNFTVEWKMKDHLRNLENIFRIIDGKNFYEGTEAEIVTAIESCTRANNCAETEYFKVRGFFNRALHITVKNKKLLDRFNEIGCGEGTCLPNPVDTPPPVNPLDAKPRGKKTEDLNYFQTTDRITDIVRVMLELPGENCRNADMLMGLEPQAGGGKLAYMMKNNGCKVHCVELDKGRASELARWHEFYEVKCMDFLDLEPVSMFDRVAMNPPFSANRDLIHVYHAAKFLKRSGILVAVMSKHWTFGQEKLCKAFREWLTQIDFDWVDLPPGSFKEYGTNVECGILKIKRSVDALNYRLVATPSEKVRIEE